MNDAYYSQWLLLTKWSANNNDDEHTVDNIVVCGNPNPARRLINDNIIQYEGTIMLIGNTDAFG